MYRNIDSLCCVPGTDIVSQVNYTSKRNKLTEKEIGFVVTRGGGGYTLEEGGHKGQTSGYKIYKY